MSNEFNSSNQLLGFVRYEGPGPHLARLRVEALRHQVELCALQLPEQASGQRTPASFWLESAHGVLLLAVSYSDLFAGLV